MEARILRLNAAGHPLEWLHWQTAVCLFSRDLVLWSLGGEVRQVFGGYSKVTGQQSMTGLPAIIACGGARIGPLRKIQPLTNRTLFARDSYQCMYCGKCLSFGLLSRDHVHPLSRGGRDCWTNVVTACRRCNQYKGNRLLRELDMELLALPFSPNAAEYLALLNGDRIREDQMEYLRPQFSRQRAWTLARAG